VGSCSNLSCLLFGRPSSSVACFLSELVVYLLLILGDNSLVVYCHCIAVLYVSTVSSALAVLQLSVFPVPPCALCYNHTKLILLLLQVQGCCVIRCGSLLCNTQTDNAGSDMLSLFAPFVPDVTHNSSNLRNMEINFQHITKDKLFADHCK
jgi:hypothetical protein